MKSLTLLELLLFCSYKKNISFIRSTNGLFVSIAHPEVELVSEEFSYDFSNLVGEAGGSMGFFLGCSLITLVEALIAVVAKVRRVIATGRWSERKEGEFDERDLKSVSRLGRSGRSVGARVSRTDAA